MPVIEWDDDKIVALEYMPAAGQGAPKKWTLPKKELVELHDKYDGGSELAYLKSWR